MSQENTPEAGAIEQLTELAENPTHSLISDVSRRTNRQVAELAESRAEEKAVIQAAQDQVERFDNWWGKVTGQHAFAVVDLETVTESSTAKIEMIGARIEEAQGYFDEVLAGAFDAGEADEQEFETLDA